MGDEGREDRDNAEHRNCDLIMTTMMRIMMMLMMMTMAMAMTMTTMTMMPKMVIVLFLDENAGDSAADTALSVKSQNWHS